MKKKSPLSILLQSPYYVHDATEGWILQFLPYYCEMFTNIDLVYIRQHGYRPHKPQQFQKLAREYWNEYTCSDFHPVAAKLSYQPLFVSKDLKTRRRFRNKIQVYFWHKRQYYDFKNIVLKLKLQSNTNCGAQ